MAAYKTIDYLPDLTPSEMNSARTLTFQPYKPVAGISSSLIEWDFEANYYTSEDYAILRDTFVFEGKEGATYDIFSHSFFDPFILELFDDKGNVVAVDQNQGTYGSDMIFSFVAPYTGKYYINASWNQGLADGHKFVSVSVYEDVGTIPSQPAPKPTPEPVPLAPVAPVAPISKPAENNIDRIFNWGESAHSKLFPEHQESKADVFGYYARLYSNGDALGEKDGNIYYYDGGSGDTGEIMLVGTVSGFLPQATAAGF